MAYACFYVGRLASIVLWYPLADDLQIGSSNREAKGQVLRSIFLLRSVASEVFYWGFGLSFLCVRARAERGLNFRVVSSDK